MDFESPAPFSAADIKFIHGFGVNLRRDIASGRNYGGLLETILNRLESFQDVSIKGSLWGPVICVPDVTSPSNDQRMVRINGPFADDHFEVMVDSSQDTSEIVRHSYIYIT